ncbi:MAG: hypothetical protein ACFFEL_13290, partial [Candidatus Thorarchaeota archaeon]
MIGESYMAYNPKSVVKYKLGERLKQSFKKVNMIHRYAKEINSDISIRYSEAFQARILTAIKHRKYVADPNTISELLKDFEQLKDNHELVSLVVDYFLQELEIDTDFKDLDENIEVFSFNDIRELRRLSYYLAKSCSDVVGEEESVSFWKRIVSLQHRDLKAEVEAALKEQEKSGAVEITVSERSDQMVKNWVDYGLVDFARVIMDEHKVLFRFDKCLTPEAMKDL